MILLPIPKQYEEKEGSLILTSKFSVNCESARVSNYLNSFIEVSEEKENTQIIFSLNPDFECEEYELKVTENSIDITGGDEEALFRGAIQGYMMRHFKPWTAIVCSALIFGLAHMNPIQIVYATLLGVVFGWIYYRTGSLLPVILGHVLNNSVAIITMLLGMEQDSNAPLSDIEKTYMAVVFVVATVVAVQLVRMLDRSLPKVSAMAENECTE